MKDLIERQIIINKLESWLKVDGYSEGELNIIKAVLYELQSMPSTQPEIIRCKDCKWSDWYDSTDGNRYCYCMETGAAGRTADDFCSYAERRTDERFNQPTGGD